MKVTLQRTHSPYRFEAKGKTGVPITIDNTSQEDAQGASPMELLLMGVGGCSAIDVIHILEKQKQTIDSYEVEVEGEREPYKDAMVFTKVIVRINLEGAIATQKALRAAKLSFEKYCSVSLTMEKSVAISYEVSVNGMIVS